MAPQRRFITLWAESKVNGSVCARSEPRRNLSQSRRRERRLLHEPMRPKNDGDGENLFPGLASPQPTGRVEPVAGAACLASENVRRSSEENKRRAAENKRGTNRCHMAAGRQSWTSK